MKIYLFTIVVALCLGSCTALHQSEIRQLEPIPFEPLSLRPTYELYDLRMDIIRQKTSEMIDSTSSSDDVPYHPLGVKLGNSLFFDVHENLSFDLLALLDVEQGAEVSIRQSFKRKGTSWKELRIDENGWCTIRQSLFKQERCFELEKTDNKVKISRNNRLRYSLQLAPDSILFFNRRGKIRDQIIKLDENTYLEGTRRRRNQMALGDTQIDLENYRIVMNEAGNELQIRRKRRRKNRLIYRIIRDQHTIFIYNKIYRGYKISIAPKYLSVHQNQKKLYEVKVIPEP